MAGESPRGWTEQDEREFQERHKTELAAQRDQEELYRGAREFVGHASQRAEQARQRGDEARAKEWDDAATAIQGGQWPISKVVQSDPAVTRWQGFRTRCLYFGATKRI